MNINLVFFDLNYFVCKNFNIIIFLFNYCSHHALTICLLYKITAAITATSKITQNTRWIMIPMIKAALLSLLAILEDLRASIILPFLI